MWCCIRLLPGRSFLGFTVLGITSFTSILRWNFKTNMDNLMSSSDKGQITLVSLLLLLLLHFFFKVGVCLCFLPHSSLWIGISKKGSWTLYNSRSHEIAIWIHLCELTIKCIGYVHVAYWRDMSAIWLSYQVSGSEFAILSLLAFENDYRYLSKNI